MRHCWEVSFVTQTQLFGALPPASWRRALRQTYLQSVGLRWRGVYDIRREYPNGVRELAGGGTWNTIAGQLTDDSEMVLLLARMLADQGR